MLEKNKDYIEMRVSEMRVSEMRVSSTDFAFVQNEPVHLCVEGLVDATNGRFPGPGEDCIIISKEKFEALQTENKQLKKKLHEFDPVFERFLKYTCGGQVSAIGWEESAKFWKKRYDDIFKLVGFSSVEEVEDYLVNEAECDTLHEAILKLIDENKYACEEWCKANSSNNSWKAAAECNTPKELMAKLNRLRDDISGRSTVIESCKRDIEKWKEKYDQSIETIGEWQRATGHFLPKAADEELASLKKEVSDYKVQIKSLYKVVESWNKVTCCSTPEEAKDWVAEIGAANGNLAQAVLCWKNATGCKTPEEAKSAIRYYKARLGNAVQSASIAIRILGNSARSEANAVRALETIGYTDPIKED